MFEALMCLFLVTNSEQSAKISMRFFIRKLKFWGSFQLW